MKKYIFYILAIFIFLISFAGIFGQGKIGSDIWRRIGNTVTLSDTRQDLVIDRYIRIGNANKSSLIAAMDADQDVSMTIIGDSTSNDGTDWQYQFLTALGEQYPTYNIQYALWNHSSQDYDSFDELQAGDGQEYLEFNGSGSANVGDSSIAEFSGDIDIRVKILPAVWPPVALEAVFAHYAGTDPNRSFYLSFYTDGTLRWYYSEDGTAASTVTASSTAAATISTSTPSWVRVVHDIDNGAAGNDVKFYTSSDGDTWNQLGTTVTVAGTVTYSNVDANWDIGARSSLTNKYNGNVYYVELRNGIDAWPPVKIPYFVDWNDNSRVTFHDTSTLRVLNGSASGQDISYFDDGTRRPKVCADYDQLLTIINLGHNETTTTGSTYISALNTFIGNVKTALPLSEIVLITQNPQKSAATNEQYQRRRRLETMSYGKSNNVPVIDTFPTFYNYEDWETDLMNDTVHPNVTGFGLEAKTVLDWFNTATPN